MLSPDVLMPLQYSRQKAAYTITIAEAFASGAVSKESLKGLPLQEAKERLMKIKGDPLLKSMAHDPHYAALLGKLRLPL